MTRKRVTRLAAVMLGALLAAGWTGMVVGGSVNALGSTEEVLVGTFDADIGERSHPQSPASHRVTKEDRQQDTTTGNPNEDPGETRDWYNPNPGQ